MESSEIRDAILGEIALVFLKLGTIAFGGPAAASQRWKTSLSGGGSGLNSAWLILASAIVGLLLS